MTGKKTYAIFYDKKTNEKSILNGIIGFDFLPRDKPFISNFPIRFILKNGKNVSYELKSTPVGIEFKSEDFEYFKNKLFLFLEDTIIYSEQQEVVIEYTSSSNKEIEVIYIPACLNDDTVERYMKNKEVYIIVKINDEFECEKNKALIDAVVKYERIYNTLLFIDDVESCYDINKLYLKKHNLSIEDFLTIPIKRFGCKDLCSKVDVFFSNIDKHKKKCQLRQKRSKVIEEYNNLKNEEKEITKFYKTLFRKILDEVISNINFFRKINGINFQELPDLITKDIIISMKKRFITLPKTVFAHHIIMVIVAVMVGVAYLLA